jgi:YidC/Oxa1 family membrane protein insertase
MDNRTIIAIVLIILLWSGYSLFFTPTPLPQTNNEQTNISASTVESRAGSQIEAIIPSDLSVLLEERLIELKNDFFTVVFSTKGATIKSISFSDYKGDDKGENSKYFLLDSQNFETYSFKSFVSEGLNIPDDIYYSLVDSAGLSFSQGNESLHLTFQAEYNGFLITKTFNLHRNSYHIDISYSIINNNQEHFAGKYNLSLITPWSTDEKSDFYSFVGPLTFDGNKLQEDKPKDVVKNSVIYNDFVWSGFTDKYFLQALNPDNKIDQVLIRYQPGMIENRFSSNSFILLPGQSESFQHVAYLGPKNLESLSLSNSSFEEAIHFGFFHFLSKPLFDVLRFFNGYINNYGFSIILLTVCIKLIFWPLTQKSYKSMQGMQKLQPEMKRLKEKYADDKQRLNQEMMSFYRDNKVNPLGGCLPILIQIPVFFSLYKVLLDSIELRHAPFILWITDLSAKDPYYITPIVMGASMFLQQKLTPTNLDPTQEKVMLMMPIIFTFLFLNFPAGLVIYWLVNNLLTILQQLIIRRQAQKA